MSERTARYNRFCHLFSHVFVIKPSADSRSTPHGRAESGAAAVMAANNEILGSFRGLCGEVSAFFCRRPGFVVQRCDLYRGARPLPSQKCEETYHQSVSSAASFG